MHIDLNLLTALDVLLEERAVGAAADRLHLSQPAMSRTLTRIRRATGDEILVRSGRAMLPTPYAEQIRDEVHQLVIGAQAVLVPAREVDLGGLERSFTVQCNDLIAEALLPKLAGHLADVAPGVRVRVLGEADTDLGGVRRERVDLQISDRVPAHSDVRSSTALSVALAVVARRDLAHDPSTWQGFVALPHVVISRRGRDHDRVDELLEERGLHRRVAFTVPTASLALRMADAHDLLTVVPRVVSLPGSLAAHPLPFATREVPAVVAWHVRHDRDAAHRWFRTLVGDTLARSAVTD